MGTGLVWLRMIRVVIQVLKSDALDAENMYI